ncbi:hypothetical protein FHW00_004214 [Ochrobactrum sp. P6BSIII]|nr:hypothetical protein [Ochrobactrum sp. P6BSIII]
MLPSSDQNWPIQTKKYLNRWINSQPFGTKCLIKVTEPLGY